MAATNQRDGLLDAACRLMLEKGYWGTTVDEICESAGVTKGSFYHHFTTKEALGLAVVDHYFARVEAALFTPELRSLSDPRERLDALLSHAIDVSRSPEMLEGCILGCFTVELSQVVPSIREALAARFEKLAGALEELIRAAFEQESPATAIDAGALARQFIAVLEGGIILAKAHARPEMLAESLRIYGELLRRSLAAAQR